VASRLDAERVERAFRWLSERIGHIAYNEVFTTEKLRYQIRTYIATKEIVHDYSLDFVGIKCQPEMADHFCSLCLSQAFLNDPYDMEGPKPIIPTACECDMDGALTMQILHLLTGLPVLFFDFRHYDPEEDIYVFSNCGSQATWYAGRSEVPEENLKRVSFYPQTPTFYPASGATVRYMAAAGEVTLARLARRNGRYWMAIMPGEFVTRPVEKMEETSPEWPQAFTKLNVKPDELIRVYGSNHAHGVAGYWVPELVRICELLDVDPVVFA